MCSRSCVLNRHSLPVCLTCRLANKEQSPLSSECIAELWKMGRKTVLLTARDIFFVWFFFRGGWGVRESCSLGGVGCLGSVPFALAAERKMSVPCFQAEGN